MIFDIVLYQIDLRGHDQQEYNYSKVITNEQDNIHPIHQRNP